MADQRLRSSGPGGSQTDVRKRRRLAGAVRSWMSYYGGFLLSLLGIIVLWYLAAHWVDDSFKFPMIEGIQIPHD